LSLERNSIVVEPSFGKANYILPQELVHPEDLILDNMYELVEQECENIVNWAMFRQQNSVIKG